MKLKKFALLTATTSGLVLAGAGAALADTAAVNSATGSPLVVSDNVAQAPVYAPVNITGNGINIIGMLNSVFGIHSEN
jgi:ChpA-C